MSCRLNHKIKSFSFLSVCMAWFALACQEDRYIVETSAGKIDFQITSDGETASRSGSDVSFEIDGQELSLVWSIEENTDSLLANESAESRGAAFDNANNCIPSIYTTAIYPEANGGKYYFKDEEVTVDSQQGTSGHFWPDQPLSFFAYAFSGNHQVIAPTFERKDAKCSGSFNYALPDASTSDTPKDATAQPDVVFAITPDQTKDNAPVELEFHHALSAIVFKVGNMPSDVKLESIAISGVYASGSCTMEPNPSEDKPLDILFEWTCSGERTYKYTEDLENSSPDSNTPQMGGSNATFMMLPQTMSDETKLVFTYKVGENVYTREKSFKEIGIEQWKADCKYIFTIGLPSSDNISVEVQDEVEGLTKKDVTIQNTGTIPGYIRATIVGYWKNAEGVIEAPWTASDGSFVNFNNSGWKKGDDGFYYHLQPVLANEETAKLFESYTISESAAKKHQDLTLELSIVAQIIPADSQASSVWPELNSSN